MKKTELYNNLVYVTDKGWVFGLDDEKQRNFGIMFEITDMAEDTGEPEFEEYPYLVSAEIMADKCHKSFDESGEKPTHDSLLYDCKSYMGGVPIDHVLTHAVQSGTETGEAFDALKAQFTIDEAMVRTVNSNYGTYAAQNGPKSKHQYLQFKTEDAARKFIDYLVEKRCSALSVMIGFILDRPINMMGEDGWRVIRTQVYGKNHKQKVG